MSSISPAVPALKAQVLCRARSGTTLTFTLKKDVSIVGREPGMAVAVPLEGVSRRHAKILWDGKNHWLEDLKSTNGTFLNGQLVHKERLRHLDVITLGKEVHLVFVLRSEGVALVKKQGILKASLVPGASDATPHEVRMGQTTLGRSPACNIVTERGTVSKFHAQIERTVDQLVLQDLASANGTFVNGSRVMTALLHNGDVVSLAGVESYDVALEMGEVTLSSGASQMNVEAVSAPAEEPRFSTEWKTRYEWGSGEIRAINALQEQIAAQERKGKTGRRAEIKLTPAAPSTPKPGAVPPVPAPPREMTGSTPPKPAAPASTPAVRAPSTPSPAIPHPAAPPASSAGAPSSKPAPPKVASPPAAPSRVASPPSPPSVPSRPTTTPTGAPPQTPAPPAVPTPEAASPRAIVSSSAQSTPTSAAPPAAAAEEASSAPSAPPAKPSPRAPSATPQGSQRVQEVRLVGDGFDIAASRPGAHDLGRATEASLRLNHPTVSRRHARIIISEDRTVAYVQDMGGTNGVRVNGILIEGIQQIQERDVISLGEIHLTVFLKVS